MKTSPSKSGPTLLKQDNGVQPVRVIKAAQAGKLLGHNHAGHQAPGTEPHTKPEIRLVHAGTDYCDLEVVCACGESTQVRCWNSPAATAKAA